MGPRSDWARPERPGPVDHSTSEAGRAIWAEVVAVGPMVRAAESGDLVLFSPEMGFEVKIRSEDYLVLREQDVHAVAPERSEGNTGLYL